MITGVHTMFYSDRADQLRAFFRDVLRFPTTDAGGGWLLFDLPSADLGVHPTSPSDPTPHNTPAISFFCDNIEQTIAELKTRGAEFVGPVQNHGYGLVAQVVAPGELKIQIYQPLYTKNSAI